MTQYIVLVGRVVGSGPFQTEYSFDGEKFDKVRAAIHWGFRQCGSDDFNIGVLKRGKLVSLDWMDAHNVETDPEELKKIAEQIQL
jgi:hypothetical protein